MPWARIITKWNWCEPSSQYCLAGKGRATSCLSALREINRTLQVTSSQFGLFSGSLQYSAITRSWIRVRSKAEFFFRLSLQLLLNCNDLQLSCNPPSLTRKFSLVIYFYIRFQKRQHAVFSCTFLCLLFSFFIQYLLSGIYLV